MADVVVVGGGVGGLATATRVAAAGHRVRVYERNAELGGKLAVRRRDGFTFDIGPSLVTLPAVFDELFRIAGTSLTEQLTMTRLEPRFRYRWPDGHEWVLGDDSEGMPGMAEFLARGRRIWEVSERTFFAGPMSGPVSLARRMRSPLDLLAIDPLRTLATSARRHFADPRLQQWAGRYATYSGSSPYRVPATLACIPYVEARYGCWYPAGGLSALRDALVRVAGRAGAELHTGAEVEAIDADRHRVRGVTLAGGERVTAEVVVVNADAEHLYTDLLPDAAARRRVQRAERSTSGFVVLAGVRGSTPGLAHHNVWFSSDYRAEFSELESGRPASEPTVYACVSSVSDSTQAPAGHENWFLLVNTPPGVEIDAPGYEQVVLSRLAAAGSDLDDRLVFTETITPADLAARYRSPGGAIYGSSSNGRRAAFVRPGNRGIRRGLYLVGGSSHPGGGLPLVALSARIVAGMIAQDGW